MITDPAQERPVERRRRSLRPLALLGAMLLGVVVGLGVLWLAVLGMQFAYAERVVPRVSVLGEDLGGLTLEQAAARLAAVADRVDAGVVALSDGETVWEAPWRELGMVLDAQATAEAALSVGHGPQYRDPRAWLRMWVESHTVTPLLMLDTNVTRRVLENLAANLDLPATDPQVALDGAAVVVTPGSAGRRLDVAASLEAIVSAVREGRDDAPILLAIKSVPAPEYDTMALQGQIDDLLGRPLEITAYDLLSDRWYTWTLGREDMVTWLRLTPTEEGETVVVDRDGIVATLTGLATQMGEARCFRWDEAADAVQTTHAAGGGKVTLEVTYAPSTYVVAAGDTAMRIAARHGMPLYALVQANPGVDLDVLSVGQEIVIPSQDVLTPLPVVPSKRIVVTLSEHRLRAYEDGALKYDWIIAVGRESSPTSVGTYQVLFKEESAYASAWDLTMPDFIGIYSAAPGFANGIHSLPFLSNGQRLWSRALGTDASYGCIILGVEEAALLYDWADIGVVVVIRP